MARRSAERNAPRKEGYRIGFSPLRNTKEDLAELRYNGHGIFNRSLHHCPPGAPLLLFRGRAVLPLFSTYARVLFHYFRAKLFSSSPRPEPTLQCLLCRAPGFVRGWKGLRF